MFVEPALMARLPPAPPPKMRKSKKGVGYWMSDKKMEKLEFQEFVTFAAFNGVQMTQVGVDCFYFSNYSFL